MCSTHICTHLHTYFHPLIQLQSFVEITIYCCTTSNTKCTQLKWINGIYYHSHIHIRVHIYVHLYIIYTMCCWKKDRYDSSGFYALFSRESLENNSKTRLWVLLTKHCVAHAFYNKESFFAHRQTIETRAVQKPHTVVVRNLYPILIIYCMARSLSEGYDCCANILKLGVIGSQRVKTAPSYSDSNDSFALDLVAVRWSNNGVSAGH